MCVLTETFATIRTLFHCSNRCVALCTRTCAHSRSRTTRKKKYKSQCLNQPALETVQMLVELYPEAVQEADKVGRLPLHSACSNQASLAVLEYLVEQFPESVCEITDRGVRMCRVCHWMDAVAILYCRADWNWDDSSRVDKLIPKFAAPGLLCLMFLCFHIYIHTVHSSLLCLGKQCVARNSDLFDRTRSRRHAYAPLQVGQDTAARGRFARRFH